jgi:dipeptidase E
MTKLFLSSLGISDALTPELAKLVGKEEKDITMAFIQNAADTYIEGHRGWVDDERATMKSHSFKVEVIDIKQYRDKLPELTRILAAKDVVWFGGGNTYYLRWLLKDTGLDKILTKLVMQGVVYGGCSAGAIIAGPTLKHFEAADDPNDAPQIILEGLHLTEMVVVPHMDHAKYAPIVKETNERLKADGYKTIPLKDSEAVIINGDTWSVV